MGVVEGERDLPAEPHDVVRREARLAAQAIAKRFAAGEWRHEIQQRRPVGLAGMLLPRVVQRQDVRMRKARRDLDLAREPLAADETRDVRVQRLHGHLTSVLRVIGEIDGRHAPTPDLTHDTISVAEQPRHLLRFVSEQWRVGDSGGHGEDRRPELARRDERSHVGAQRWVAAAFAVEERRALPRRQLERGIEERLQDPPACARQRA